ncbi:DJ-1/PfpI family protein [Marinococcus sp. PL1-022]|jgi:protease I|uniref:DJ-1/PfpI family protein n=1 Tax=Marinococcus sp. PL1-022 TaxID=3095363 RepID=UPI002626BBC0|nr:DJ-1/PfpI family protein [Marinococcus sp. PL1-022]MDX6154219.1 DJ-1/PfpI family protein [Marinococcus sp. PL1-022]
MSAKRVLIVAGDAVEALEVYYPYFRCMEEGFHVDLAAASVKKLHTVIHDFEDWETYTEKPGYGIEANVAFEGVNASDYDALIIPGGRAPEHIRMNNDLLEIVKHFFEKDKPIAIMCHGSLVLTPIAEVAKGRKMTAYQACKPEVESMGAEYINEMDYVDKNLVSGHAWPDLPAIMREFVKQVNDAPVTT